MKTEVFRQLIRKVDMLNKKTIFYVFVILAVCSVFLSAGSIWDKRNRSSNHLYTDDTARSTGDIITIIISEISNTENETERTLEKDTGRSSTFNGDVGDFADLGEFGMSSESSTSLEGNTELEDERIFEDRMTAVVVDVMPNGNLIISGTRSRDISGDTQTIKITGIVRPSDISYNNTIESQQIANFKIVNENAGMSEPYTRTGWLTGILNLLWPF
jgi:flagellar L-ring protein precursor FlgH